MQLSDFGRKMSSNAGILQLMDDLGKSLSTHPPKAMFGGGNPAQIPAVTTEFKKSLLSISKDPKKMAAMFGNYDAPQGNAEFIKTITNFLNRHYGLSITEANVAITPGSQTGYFILFNLIAGKTGNKWKKILFPLVPEYIGYVDQSLEPGGFMSQQPKIEKIGKHEFKYHVNYDSPELSNPDVSGICVSRPTNPSGNVVSDKELEHLGNLASKRDIPLIIDNAYGLPFPGVIVPDTRLFWNSHTILSMSLSKIGLPSSRVGIFIGPEKLMKAMTNANAIISLANPSFGQYISNQLIDTDEILRLSSEHIKPYYFDRAEKAKAQINKHFPDDLPWRFHRYDGSYFFWLWLEGSKMTSKELYAYLRERSVLVVPGEYFFPGQDIQKWQHSKECLRLNFARPDKELEYGMPVIAEAIKQAYK